MGCFVIKKWQKHPTVMTTVTNQDVLRVWTHRASAAAAAARWNAWWRLPWRLEWGLGPILEHHHWLALAADADAAARCVHSLIACLQMLMILISNTHFWITRENREKHCKIRQKLKVHILMLSQYYVSNLFSNLWQNYYFPSGTISPKGFRVMLGDVWCYTCFSSSLLIVLIAYGFPENQWRTKDFPKVALTLRVEISTEYLSIPPLKKYENERNLKGVHVPDSLLLYQPVKIIQSFWFTIFFRSGAPAKIKTTDLWKTLNIDRIKRCTRNVSPPLVQFFFFILCSFPDKMGQNNSLSQPHLGLESPIWVILNPSLYLARFVERCEEKNHQVTNIKSFITWFFSPGCCELVLGDTHRLMGRQTDGSAETEPGSDVLGLELPAQPGPPQLPPVSLGGCDGENGPITGTATLPIR